jgi:shikimate dehydrogenase
MSISAQFGLIGYPLGHSFSKKYFTEKFAELALSESHSYEQFPISSIDELPALFAEYSNTLRGLNVTIPYKQQVIPYLDEIDPAAERIGAVNTIKILPNGRKIGYNSDYWGFRRTVEQWPAFENFRSKKALVLGQGGAAKAVIVALQDLGMEVVKVSRMASGDTISYEMILAILDEIGLIVNSTPLGMSPNLDTCPPLPYESLGAQHYFYDLVYNPLETEFLKRGLAQGIGGIHTGIDMLHGQADKAWEIWQA